MKRIQRNYEVEDVMKYLIVSLTNMGIELTDKNIKEMKEVLSNGSYNWKKIMVTVEENIFNTILSKLDIQYERQYRVRREEYGVEYKIDFLIQKPKVLGIEIDGGYHRDRVGRDFQRDMWLMKKGYPIIRLNNEDIHKIKEVELVEILKDIFKEL